VLNASTLERNSKDVRYGNGQYLSDIVPREKSHAQLSREFLRLPYLGRKFTHYVEIDIEGLVIIEGRRGVFVVPNYEALTISERIVSWGVVPID
jgi:HYD1 signature containing ADP-ribosyltransferase